MTPQDFDEEDEPADEIYAIFERGEKRRTKPPARGDTRYLYFNGPPAGQAVVTTAWAVLHGDRLSASSAR